MVEPTAAFLQVGLRLERLSIHDEYFDRFRQVPRVAWLDETRKTILRAAYGLARTAGVPRTGGQCRAALRKGAVPVARQSPPAPSSFEALCTGYDEPLSSGKLARAAGKRQ